MVVAAGAIGGAAVGFDIRIPDDGAFTDGHWEGTVTTSVLVLSTGDAVGIRHEATAPFEFTITDGAVAAGSFAMNFSVEFTLPTGTGEGVAAIGGEFVGCGFSPQMLGHTFGVDGTLTTSDGITFPMQFEQPFAGTEIGFGTTWAIDEVTDPDTRTGEIDVSGYTNYMRANGFGASDVIVTFEATRR